MNLFGKKEAEAPHVPSKFLDEIESLTDQAEIAETVEEQREINKSILSLIAENVEPIAKAVSPKSQDDDEDDDLDEETEDDDDLDEDPEDVPAKPVGKKLRKSVAALDEDSDESEEVDAGPILKSISRQLNQANALSEESRSMILKSVARVSRLESRLDDLASSLNPILDFVQDVRDTPQGTPTGNAPANNTINKSLNATTGSIDPAGVGEDEVTEIHGMDVMAITKGVANFMLENPNSERVTNKDFDSIGKVPLNELDKKLIKVAAEQLGVEID